MVALCVFLVGMVSLDWFCGYMIFRFSLDVMSLQVAVTSSRGVYTCRFGIWSGFGVALVILCVGMM